MYQTTSRKYRPQTFSQVIGQHNIVVTLKNALKKNQIAHAYLFCGSRGTGKTSLARIFAKALNCKNRSEEMEPCCRCTSCLETAQGRHLDLLEIDGASHRGIEDIRQINETVSYASSGGGYKIYLIDEVHMLTKEAFNALLKTLEEPPPKVLFLFATTEPHKVLSTIISRCQRFDLKKIPSDLMKKKMGEIAHHLEVQIDQEALEEIVSLADGSLRDAESLLDQIACYGLSPINREEACRILGLPPVSLFTSLDRAIENADLSFAFSCSHQLFEEGRDLSRFCEKLLEHMQKHLAARLANQSNAFYSIDHLLYILDFLLEWTQRIVQSPFAQRGLEIMLLHLIRSRHRITIDTLTQKLTHLTASIPLQDQAPKIERPKETLKQAPLPDSATAFFVEEKKEPVPIPRREWGPVASEERVRWETLLRFAAVEWEGTYTKSEI